MACTSLVIPLGSSFVGKLSNNHRITNGGPRKVTPKNLNLGIKMITSQSVGYEDEFTFFKRRDVIGLALSASSLLIYSLNAKAGGLPPEEIPTLCDKSCEKELENVPMVTTESGLQYKDIKVGSGPTPPVGYQVAANYVAMVPSGQIFDSSLEKRQVYIFRVGSGQVVKGLDEGILSMKVGGKRRIYVPGS
nr:peptidyl-prolyl cis-trans isomerase FKBP16-3, chloroplastic isoform X1 [Tanacetum cinerariifolium]